MADKISYWTGARRPWVKKLLEAGEIGENVMAQDTKDLEGALERIRATEGVTRTVTEVVLSTLFQR